MDWRALPPFKRPPRGCAPPKRRVSIPDSSTIDDEEAASDLPHETGLEVGLDEGPERLKLLSPENFRRLQHGGDRYSPLLSISRQLQHGLVFEEL